MIIYFIFLFSLKKKNYKKKVETARKEWKKFDRLIGGFLLPLQRSHIISIWKLLFLIPSLSRMHRIIFSTAITLVFPYLMCCICVCKFFQNTQTHMTNLRATCNQIRVDTYTDIWLNNKYKPVYVLLLLLLLLLLLRLPSIFKI